MENKEQNITESPQIAKLTHYFALREQELPNFLIKEKRLQTVLNALDWLFDNLNETIEFDEKTIKTMKEIPDCDTYEQFLEKLSERSTDIK